MVLQALIDKAMEDPEHLRLLYYITGLVEQKLLGGRNPQTS